MQWEFNKQCWLPWGNQTRATNSCGQVLGPTTRFLYTTLSSCVVISTCTITPLLSLAPLKPCPPFEFVAGDVSVVLDSSWSRLYPWPTESTYAPLLQNAIPALRFVFARLSSQL